MSSLMRELRESGRYNLYLMLGLSAAFSCLMVVVRPLRYEGIVFPFLIWNLFLAAIPFAISQFMWLRPVKSGTLLVTGLFLWLLFFPNAPYILTDLMHISSRRAAPFWFDLVLLVSFAWNGLMLGHLSLLEVHRIVDERFGTGYGWIFTVSAVVMGSFGIYVGRFLRWNSWDVFIHPYSLVSDIADQLLHPWQGPSIYGVTLLFSIFLMLGYLVLRALPQAEITRAEPASVEERS